MSPDGVVVRFRYDWRHGHDGVLGLRLRLLGLVVAGIEPVLAHVGRPGQDLMHGADSPASAVAGPDVLIVQARGDGLEPHRSALPVTGQRPTVDGAHDLGLERIDLQLLLGLGPALLGGDDAVPNRRAGAVPEALPGVLFHGPQSVLGVLPGLVLVEERHDLPHHHAHGIVAQLLGDGDQTHPILGQLPDIEFELELVAEEPREAVHHDDVEAGRLDQGRLDHRLE
ncbi:MAG: hypothetical protein PSV23_02270 [Brevundimonas sp.]|nr:hypothetical protein [Brevundimonas sp.]MDI1325602.1 hypothetical protein [Brevundimonas sp.]